MCPHIVASSILHSEDYLQVLASEIEIMCLTDYYRFDGSVENMDTLVHRKIVFSSIYNNTWIVSFIILLNIL